eukprot:13426-Heterococcus_DN1.PRE.3
MGLKQFITEVSNSYATSKQAATRLGEVSQLKLPHAALAQSVVAAMWAQRAVMLTVEVLHHVMYCPHFAYRLLY